MQAAALLPLLKLPPGKLIELGRFEEALEILEAVFIDDDAELARRFLAN